jgi:hypothetical protein
LPLTPHRRWYVTHVADAVTVCIRLRGVGLEKGSDPELRETKSNDLHEVSVSAWRIIYHPRNNDIYIITVVHMRQRLEEDRLQH